MLNSKKMHAPTMMGHPITEIIGNLRRRTASSLGRGTHGDEFHCWHGALGHRWCLTDTLQKAPSRAGLWRAPWLKDDLSPDYRHRRNTGRGTKSTGFVILYTIPAPACHAHRQPGRKGYVRCAGFRASRTALAKRPREMSLPPGAARSSRAKR